MTISIRALLEAGVHFGHRTRSWNPKMAPYIHGSHNKVHIINLDKTKPLLEEAANYLASIAAKGGKILFVGTKRAAQESVREQAQRAKMPYVDYRWLGGMLTNYRTIRQSVKYLRELEAMQQDGSYQRFTKREILNFERKKTKLERSLGGIKEIGGLPDALFIIDVGHERIAIEEARRLGIPVVGVVDTNCNPEGIDYIIPGNDDASRAIALYTSYVADAIIHAKQALSANAAALATQQGTEEQSAAPVAETQATPVNIEEGATA